MPYLFLTSHTRDIKSMSNSQPSAFDRAFKQFRFGAAIFFVGFVGLYGVQQLMQPSLFQEVLAAFFVVVIVGGLATSLLAEGRMLCQRLWSFFKKK